MTRKRLPEVPLDGQAPPSVPVELLLQLQQERLNALQAENLLLLARVRQLETLAAKKEEPDAPAT